jgi:hypothetical protein
MEEMKMEGKSIASEGMFTFKDEVVQSELDS